MTVIVVAVRRMHTNYSPMWENLNLNVARNVASSHEDSRFSLFLLLFTSTFFGGQVIRYYTDLCSVTSSDPFI